MVSEVLFSMNHKKETPWLFKSLRGKGYYIALILCACVIGVGGYVYNRNVRKAPAGQGETAITQPVAAVPKATKPVMNQEGGGLVPAIGTTPTLPAVPVSPEASASEPAIRRTVWPVEGESLAVFAMDHLAYNQTTRDWRVHNGVDLCGAAGTEVRAAAEGKVRAVYTDEVMGPTVVLEHAGGFVTTYSSLEEEPELEAGAKVACGEVIGTVGTTALTETALEPHVHFAVTCGGSPVDPAEFLPREE